jgi:glycosyltransferase involved in cell wall biosynthesis
MLRYAELLAAGLRERGVSVDVIRPSLCLGRLSVGTQGLGKWLGYFDKFIVFPWRLSHEARRVPGRVVHLCDHSNAMYTAVLHGVPHVVTCHDVLAIRSALGHFPQNPTGWSGRRLQAWITRGLARAALIVCVSATTRSELIELLPEAASKIRVVPNALNAPYAPMPDAAAAEKLAAFPAVQSLGAAGYIFHVGGNAWYKNRAGVLRIYFAYVRQGGRTPLVLAGKPATAEMQRLLATQPLGARVITVGEVDDLTLNALYARAACLLFPSLAEGFGWPLLEAMSAGCPVVTSRRPPMNEVAGAAAVYVDPLDEMGAAGTLAQLLAEDAASRARRIAAGQAQAMTFSAENMFAGVIAAYRAVQINGVARADA